MRENIVNVAADKMRRFGIKSISVDDICRELGISKKTFYVYFENKDELIRELLRRHESEMGNWIEQKTKGKSVIDLLLSFMSIAMNTQDVRRNPPLFYDLRKYYPQLFDEHIDKVHAMSKRFLQDYIQRGVDEGTFRSDLDVKRTAAILAYLHHELLNLSPQITDNYYSQVISHVRYATDIFMRGIISDEGRRLVEDVMKKKRK